MGELIYTKNDQAVTTSLLVAESSGKRHSDVLRRIEQLIKEDSTQNCVRCFFKDKYIDASGKANSMYYMNRDGYVFLTMGFTGVKANEWKWKYIEAFNQMENLIRFQQTDKILQKHNMEFLQNNLQMPVPRDYIKANTIANKCISNKYGYTKMIKKSQMSPKMLKDRQEVLRDTVELMAAKEKFSLDIDISSSIYNKHQALLVTQ